jgi:hypothetical protein
VHFQVVEFARLGETWRKMPIQFGPHKAVELASYRKRREEYLWCVYVV